MPCFLTLGVSVSTGEGGCQEGRDSGGGTDPLLSTGPSLQSWSPHCLCCDSWDQTPAGASAPVPCEGIRDDFGPVVYLDPLVLIQCVYLTVQIRQRAAGV